MDIRKAINYLKGELRNLDRVIDAIEVAAASRYEKIAGKAAQNPVALSKGSSGGLR